MNRFPGKIAALFIACLALGLGRTVAEKPNVLFIAIDDLNDWVGCLEGHPNAKTPNIDRLAKQGVLFENAHCQAPICGPSRASIFTGLYPSSTGIYLQIRDQNIKSSHPLTERCALMPDYFERHGYKTMAVGKLYHGGDAANTFDEYGGRFEWFGPKPEKRFKFDPDWYDHKIGSTQTDWGAYPDKDEEMTDHKVAKWAVDKLGQSHDKPFFLAVGFLRPHVPWYTPPHWFDHHPLDTVQTPPYKKNDYDDIPEGGQRVADVPMMPTTEELIASGEWKKAVQAYLTCITWVDYQVGKVLDALEASDHAKDTLIVLWSDHGYHLGEKNRFAKQAIWERNTRVPLIFAGPGIEPDRRCSRPVGLIDLYPTLVELCGLPVNEMNEGASLASLIESVRAPRSTPAITTYGPFNHAIRSEQYRYIQYEDGSEELYDMIADPNEWTNLSHKESLQPVIAELKKHIPSKPARLAPGSSYDINEYFISRQKEWLQLD